MSDAGDLYHRVAFDVRVDAEDGAGNTQGDWEEQFSRRAAFTHLRGGESVMASRLEGKHIQVIRVRACAQTRQVTTDWQVRDVRTAVAYNIRDVTPDSSRLWIDFLVESGGATG